VVIDISFDSTTPSKPSHVIHELIQDNKHVKYDNERNKTKVNNELLLASQ